MAKPKLTKDQRATLLAWIAADYDSALIKEWANRLGWPEIGRSTLSYYRSEFAPLIEEIRKQRHSDAIATGLALKEERVARLKRHADALEAIKWQTDKNGRCWNEKAWRETLDDIAREMGHRKAGVEISGDFNPVVNVILNSDVSSAKKADDSLSEQGD